MKLNKNDIFVFGSNEAGIHGAGAAKMAYDLYGMPIGKSYGHYNQCFAIPTKDPQIQTLGLNIIRRYIDGFVAYAHGRRKLTFKVTQIGCGLAGLDPADIAPLFDGCTSNVLFDRAWDKYLPGKKLPVDRFWGTFP